MSDELATKLSEAQKHFSSHSYEACSKTLGTCSQSDSDPKIRHNLYISDYSKGGFAQSLQALNNLRGLVINNNINTSSPTTTNGSAISTPSTPPATTANNNTNNQQKIPLVNTETASWEFDGQDLLHYNEACIRAHIGELDVALELLSQLIGLSASTPSPASSSSSLSSAAANNNTTTTTNVSSKAPVSVKVQIRASALAYVLKRQINVRNNPSAGSATSTGMVSAPNTRDIQELLNSNAFKTQLSESEQKELQGVVAAATASDLTSIQTWLDKHTSKQANDVAVMLNNAAVQLMYKAATADEDAYYNAGNNGNNSLGENSFTAYNGSATATQLLTQAVAAADATPSTQACPMQAATIRFNLGLAHFAAGNLVGALTAMIPAQRVMSDNPIYWFRLGQVLANLGREQAVAVARSSLDSALQSRAKRLHEKGERPSTVVVPISILAEGLLDITTGNIADETSKTPSATSPTTTTAPAIPPPASAAVQPPNGAVLAASKEGPSYSAPQLFALAETALQNAYVLMFGRLNGSTSSTNTSTTSSTALDLGAIVGQSPVGTQELIQALILYLTFTALSRGNHQVAAKFSTDYFAVRCAAWNQHRDITAAMLCYAVEALCSVQRAPQALKLLQGQDLGELIFVDNNSASNSSNAGPNSGGGSTGLGAGVLDQACQDALLVNVCIAHIMNGNWQKALSIGNTVLPRLYARSPNAVLLSAYLELARGNREKALEIFEKVPLREPM